MSRSRLNLKRYFTTFFLSVLCQTFIGGTAVAATKPCRIVDFPQEVQCGQVQRPLDPAQAEGKKIAIHFVVVPSQDRNKLPDAMFFLPGGPGQSAINLAGVGKAIFSRLNRRRDLVFVDQRGTGRSAPLICPASDGQLVDDEGAVKKLAACQKQLQALPYGDLRFFNTSIAVQDLEAVRKEQGYGAINLVGVSYGTRMGLEYLRQYPHSVKRMVLDGVAPPSLQISAGEDIQTAMLALLSDCAHDARCNQAYPKLDQHWQSVLSSLPRQVTVTHPRLGNVSQLTLTRELLLRLVMRALYAPGTSAALPYALMQATQNNFAPLFTLSGAGALPGPGDVALGMHFSVVCAEDFSPNRPRSVAVKSDKPDDFSSQLSAANQAICASWPRANVPAAFYTIPVSAAPVLLLSGGIDPVTPTRHAAGVAKALGAKARLVEIKNAGHGLLQLGCVSDVAYRYLNASDDADAIKVDAQCVRQIPRALAWTAPISRPSSSMSTASPAGATP